MGSCAEMSEFLVSAFDQFLQHDNRVGKGNALRIWPVLLDTLYPNLKGVAHLSRKLALVRKGAFALRLCSMSNIAMLWSFGVALETSLYKSTFEGVGLDANCSEDHTCLMSFGVRLWMNLLMSCVEPWMAPCSSFLVLCLALSQRYDYNDWWSEQATCTSKSLPSVCLARPLNSRCLCQLPPMPSVLLVVRATKSQHILELLVAVFRNLCKSGAPQQFTLNWYVQSQTLHVFLEHLVTRNDNGSFTGVKDLLVESGAYTRKFGQHVSKIFAEELQAKQSDWNAAGQTCVPSVASPQDMRFINCCYLCLGHQ